MRFMTFYRPGKEAMSAPSQELMAAMGKELAPVVCTDFRER